MRRGKDRDVYDRDTAPSHRGARTHASTRKHDGGDGDDDDDDDRGSGRHAHHRATGPQHPGPPGCTT